MGDWKAFFRYASRRGGVAHVRDGRPFGLSPASVGNHWRRNGWPMPHPGVVVLPGTPRDLGRRALAAVTWVGDPVAATGVTALRLHGVVDRDPTRLQLVVPSTRRNRGGRWGSVHRSAAAFESHLETIAHVPVTSVARAIRDRVVFGGPGHPRTLAIQAIQRGRATLEELEHVVSANPCAPGMPRLAEVLVKLRRDLVDSGLELDVRDIVRCAGHEPWPRPFPTAGPDRHVMHLDIAFPDHWVGIECEHPVTHGDDAFTRDRTRWSQARRAGWQLVFVWRDRLRTDRDGFLEELAEAMADRDPERRPAQPAHDCSKAGC